MSNKGYNKEEKSFEAKNVIQENAPIEAAPVAEEVKEDIKEIPEVRQEVKPVFQPKKEMPKFVAPKQQARVILVVKDGCFAEKLDQPGQNVRMHGQVYANKQIGDIIEF